MILKLDEECKLADIYSVCLKKTPNQLRDLTRDKLTIKPNSLEDWYQKYFNLPWLIAFTLNIDNLEEVANNQFELTRRCTSISATSNFTSSLNKTKPDSLQFVHLNGCLNDLPDKVTFSTIQYAQRLKDHDPWNLEISNYLSTHSVIFIGTHLDEPPLWSYLSLRGHKGGKSLVELRPRSYLVTPNLTLARKSLLSSFNIVHIPMTASQFGPGCTVYYSQ